jgi:hypothetical protein
MTKVFFIQPEIVIPKQEISKCNQCYHFREYGGSYGDYHTCMHPYHSGDDLVNGAFDGIDQSCPILKGQGSGL